MLLVCSRVFVANSYGGLALVDLRRQGLRPLSTTVFIGTAFYLDIFI